MRLKLRDLEVDGKRKMELEYENNLAQQRLSDQREKIQELKASLKEKDL